MTRQERLEALFWAIRTLTDEIEDEIDELGDELSEEDEEELELARKELAEAGATIYHWAMKAPRAL